MHRKATAKEEQPVNISISFNIAPNEVVKQHTEKYSPGSIRGRKIRNLQTLKSNRGTPMHNYFGGTGMATNRAEELTERLTFSKVESQEQQKKRKMKRQSMDGIFESKPQRNSLFISCQNDRIISQEPPKAKLASTTTTRRKVQKTPRGPLGKQQNMPTYAKSDTLKSGPNIESKISKSILQNRNRQLSFDGLKNLICKLVAEQLHKQEHRIREDKNVSKQPKSARSNNQKLQKKKKSETHRKLNDYPRKRPTSRQSNNELTLKLNSLKQMDDSSIIKSETSDKEPPSIHIQRTKAPAQTQNLKTSASNAHLQQLVRVKYPNPQPEKRIYTNVEQQMAIRIQRFWRSYRTKGIVEIYINYLRESQRDPSHFLMDFESIRSMQQPRVQYVNRPENVQALFNEQNLSQRIESYEDDKQPEPKQNVPQIKEQKQIKTFRSVQFPKQEDKNMIDFKKREAGKWEETIEYISKNIDKTDIRTVLMQVISKLETNKNQLQREFTPSKVNNDKADLASFTVALDSKKLQSHESEQIDKDISQLAHSYINEDDEEAPNISLDRVHLALKDRRKALEIKKIKEMKILDGQLESGRLDLDSYGRELEKINRWFRHEQGEIKKAKEHIEKGLSKAKVILEKTEGDVFFFTKLQRQKKASVFSKCLSDVNLARYRHSAERKAESEESEQQLFDDYKKLKNELSSERLKEKLRQLNKERGQEQNKIGFESVSDDYNDSQSDLSGIEREVKNELELEKHHTPTTVDKFSVLDESDKNDIVEFVFWDMCIQFCQQLLEDKPKNLIRQLISKTLKPQQQTKKFKGIKTSIAIVKEYLKKFIAFMFRTNKDLMDRVCIPMGPSALEMLKYMHYSEEDADDEEQDLIGTLVLPTSIFEAFQNNLLAGIEFQPYYDDPDREHNRIQFLKGVIHIHNKAIFDCLNESLDLERPFGIWGKPFPWKKVPEFEHQLTLQQKQDKFKRSSDRVIENCTFVCGIIIDKEDSLVAPGTRLSEDYIDQVKEDRLSRMLASDLIENEERWVFYDDEETEVLVQMAYLTYEMILKEAVVEITTILRSSNRV